ncbi:hypothetical protein JXO52_06810 [bacterium]|nr:hypothetical protein [bacterium]
MCGHEHDHANKMCALACCPCNLNLDVLKPLVRDPKYICKSCGRVANDAEHLCQPEKL